MPEQIESFTVHVLLQMSIYISLHIGEKTVEISVV